MVIVDPNWPPQYPTPWYPDTEPLYPAEPLYPMEWTHPKKAKERHIQDVKKGIMIKFDDGTWMFIATDDACYEKIKKAIKDE